MAFECAVLFTKARTSLTLMPIPESPVWFPKPFSSASPHAIPREPHEAGIVPIPQRLHGRTLRPRTGEKCFPVSPGP